MSVTVKSRLKTSVDKSWSRPTESDGVGGYMSRRDGGDRVKAAFSCILWIPPPPKVLESGLCAQCDVVI